MMTERRWRTGGCHVLLFFVCAVAIATCQGERGPIGPAGPEGTPGTMGCLACHNDQSDIPRIVGQWENSVHASGEHVQYGNATNYSFCGSYCHTSEGFVSLVEDTATIDVRNPSAIGCATCHAPHTNQNFDLRTEAAFALKNGASFDMGKGNICVNCHNATEDVNTYVTDPTSFKTSVWGPHSSGQADILLGVNGYEYPEYTGYGRGYHNTYHTEGLEKRDGCIWCHMKVSKGYALGGHSWNMRWQEDYNVGGCNTVGCHSRLEDFDRNGAQTTIQAYLDTLGQALTNAGLLDSSYQTIKTATTSGDSAGAVWNFLMVRGDRSGGIHNTKYALALLKSALVHLRDEL